MTKSAPFRKSQTPEAASPARGLGAIDAALLAILLIFALFMMARSGARRGMDLLPWPDGLEYAAVAVNLDHGLGPVLHFGGYSYPSRYTEGYPLILAAAYPILGGHVERLFVATMAMGLVAIAALYLLTLMMFGRASAFFACLLLAASPIFVTYSTLVLSDVPTLTVTLLTALALYYASDAEDAPVSSPAWIASAALCGLLAGFTVMIRPTNATMLIGVAVAMIMAPFRRRLAELVPAAIAFGAYFAIFPLWQMWTNFRYLGSPMRSGYVFWVPEVYGSFVRIFGARFLFGPTMPNNPHGNFISYLFILTGLDGLLGGPGDPRYLLYPFAAAIFSVMGIILTLKLRTRPVVRVMWFGLAFLAVLLFLYLFYFFTDIAFILPATFILFAAAGFGIAMMNRAMLHARARRDKSSRELAAIALAIGLDALLVVSIAIEVAGRISTSPAPSKMAPTLLSIRSQLPSNAIVVSNISLQFLELYLAKPKTKLIGLHAFDPGGEFTDYHLARLYAKKAAGWDGRAPAVLFAGSHLDDHEAQIFTDAAHAGQPLFLLLTAPERRDYGDVLKDEIGQLGAAFVLEPIARSELVELYRVIPR